MKKGICILLIMIMSMTLLSGCSALEVIGDILSVNSADTSDDGPKVTINKPTATPTPTDTPVPTPTATPTPTKEAKNMVYCISPVNVRAGGTNQAAIIGELAAGDAVEKLGEENSWIKIKYEGKEGWVYNKYMSDKKTGE
ncbi:MAG: SH3 domain-containing protein [Clostridia bacterium]|nr:SH3 domain-containing protein [Clostridia bacterium]NCC42609.1 SH3 domain-containing protein [Clostridia bacterium]